MTRTKTQKMRAKQGGPVKGNLQALVAQAVAAAMMPAPQQQAKKRKQRKRQPEAGAVVGFGQVGTAVRVRRNIPIGMADLMAHRISWVAGYIYVGLSGTLGATNGVYFKTQTGTYTVPGLVPVVGSDTQVGQTYIEAISALYRRKRIRKCSVHFLPLQSSTTNNMTYTVAPVRGPPGDAETGNGKQDATAATPQITVMSMTGNETRDSFEGLDMDLTPYIAGGSGAAQNEFAITNNEDQTSLIPPADAVPTANGLVPCCFVVGGTSSVAALQGTNTHAVVICQTLDFLDFVGALPVQEPED